MQRIKPSSSFAFLLLVVSNVLILSQKCSSQTLWKGCDMESNIGPICVISPDSSLMCIAGQNGIELYSTAMPPKLISRLRQRRYTMSGLPNCLYCFNASSTSLYVISGTAVEEYAVTDLGLKNSKHIVDSTYSLNSLLGVGDYGPSPLVRFDTIRNGIVLRFRTETRRRSDTSYSTGYLFLQQHDSLWQAKRASASNIPLDAGHTEVSCVMHNNSDTLDVIDINTGAVLSSFKPLWKPYSCSSNAKLVAYTQNLFSDSDSLAVHDLETGRLLWKTELKAWPALLAPIDPVTELNFIDDSTLCVHTDHVQFYSLRTGSLVYSFPSPSSGSLRLPQGNTLITTQFYGRRFSSAILCLYDDELSHTPVHGTGFRILDAQNRIVYSSTADSVMPAPIRVEYSPDGSSIAFRETYDLTKIASSASGKVLCVIKDAGVFCTHGSEFLCVGNNSTRVYSATTASVLREFNMHSINVSSIVSVSPNGSLFALADTDSLRIYNLVTGILHSAYKLPHFDSVVCMQISENDSVLICLGRTGSLFRISLSTQAINTVALQSTDELRPACISADATVAACIAHTPSTRVYSIQTFSTLNGTRSFTSQTRDYGGGYCNVGLSSEGRTLLINEMVEDPVNTRQYFDIYDTHRSEPLHTKQEGPFGSFSYETVACEHNVLSPSGNQLCTWLACLSAVTARATPVNDVPELEFRSVHDIDVSTMNNRLLIRPRTLVPRTFALYDLLGNRVWNESEPSLEVLDLNTSALPSGVYYLVACYANNRTTIAVVIAH